VKNYCTSLVTFAISEMTAEDESVAREAFARCATDGVPGDGVVGLDRRRRHADVELKFVVA
jgi:hypothetical protein